MPPKTKPPSFGSRTYWETRFTSTTLPFDWLSNPSTLDPHITSALQATPSPAPQILHMGCGSSLLSQHLKTHVRSARQVHNVDFSPSVIIAERRRDEERVGEDGEGECMRWDCVDLLDGEDLLRVCGRSAYDLVVDKSTSDAISCAEDVVVSIPSSITKGRKEDVFARGSGGESKEILFHPLHVMAINLAIVTKPGARWIALSYTVERYPFLEDDAAPVEGDGTGKDGIPDPGLLWTIISKHQIEAEQEDGSSSAVTHRPKVYHWVYVLQRTSELLHNDISIPTNTSQHLRF